MPSSLSAQAPDVFELPGMPEIPAAHRAAQRWLGLLSNANTAAAYRVDLRALFAWCVEHELDVLQVRRGDVAQFRAYLEQGGLSTATVARRLSAVRQFYRWVVDEDLMDCSPAAALRLPRVPDASATEELDKKECQLVLTAAEETGRQDLALCCVFMFDGLRVSEVCSADIADLRRARGMRVLLVTRKGGNQYKAPLGPRTEAAIDLHLSGRRSGPLFVGRRGERLTRSAAYRLVRCWGRAAGIDKEIYPHSLRHAFCTRSLDENVPLRDVQDAMGHADPRTTRRYDRSRHSIDRHPASRLEAALESSS